MTDRLSDDELLAHLRSGEDSFVERETSTHEHKVKRTAVAFANSVRSPRVGILFLGVNSNGDAVGSKISRASNTRS